MQPNYPKRLHEFLDNTFIKNIATEPRWTISHPAEKKPMDAYLFMNESRLAGASFKRGYNPLTDLYTLVDWLTSSNMYPTNLTYYLNGEINRQIVLDIEPTCPKGIANDFITSLPWEYAETSLSGNGIHLGLTLPKNHTLRFDKLTVLQSPDSYYEYLFNNHYITFTMNQICSVSAGAADNVMDYIAPLYKDWDKKQLEKKEFALSETKPNIPEEAYLLSILRNVQFSRTLSDYGNNHSRYEFACGCSFLYKIKKLINITKLRNITYSDSMLTWLVYDCLVNYLDPRPKHDTYRNDLPFLLYEAQQIVAKLGGKPV